MPKPRRTQVLDRVGKGSADRRGGDHYNRAPGFPCLPNLGVTPHVHLAILSADALAEAKESRHPPCIIVSVTRNDRSTVGFKLSLAVARDFFSAGLALVESELENK